MEKPHVHQHTCTHCACNNPILATLKDDLFNPENFAALPASKSAPKQEQTLSMMISGGTIRPMINGSVATVPAIGIAGGYVVVNGTEAEVKSYMEQHHAGFKSRKLDDGNTLLPGLIEPHVHIIPTALLMGWMDVGAFEGQDLKKPYDIPSVTKVIRDHVGAVKEGEWLLGFGLDPALMPFIENKEHKKELITITAELLDIITDKVPLMILSASMHTLYLNTPALEAVYNNPKNTKLRDKYKHFQDYLDATHGQLQQEEGMDPAITSIPKPQVIAMFLESFTHIKTIFSTANERGVTFLYDAGMNNGLKALLDAYLAFHSRVVRIGAAQICSTIKDVSELKEYKKPTKYEDVYIGNVKVVSDGSNQGLTGYQSEPYLCDPQHNYGIFNFGTESKPTNPPDKYKELIEAVIVGKGWPLMIHANGNLAVQFAISVYQEYIPKQKEQGLRHRIEHCSLITQEELATMKQLGISPSFLIGHVGYWGYAFQEAIFGDKSSMLDLCNSALKHGMKITLHSDNQVSPLGPLRMMEQSITRIMEKDKSLNVLNAPECITAEQALTAITYDAAWQCNAEQWTGSLVKDNFADFVILKQDPLTLKTPYMNMRNIPVLETWVGGVPVYINS